MEPLFSEFSYGYAITKELSSGKFGGIVRAPRFPSLYEEGQTGGGYDVEIPFFGTSLFLQYKLSHYLVRSNASEWDVYEEPYYRMYLRPLMYSDQHNLLLQLEKSHDQVYYVAPRFHLTEELDHFYISGLVAENSVFIQPSNIGVLDDDWHYITFLSSSQGGLLWSEDPKNLVKIYSRQIFENQILESKLGMRKIDGRYLDEIANNVIDILETFEIGGKRVQSLRSAIKESETLSEKYNFISYLAMTNLDAEFIIVSRKE